MARARNGEPGFPVSEWQVIRRTLGPAVAGGPPAASVRVPTPVAVSATLVTTIGAPGGGPGQLLDPHGVAVDADGNVYVADSGNARVQKFDKAGKALLAWGSKGAGEGQFLQPWSGVVDGQGIVYVLDSDQQTIQRFDREGKFCSR